MDIRKNVELLFEEIAEAAARSGRTADDITLVAATKTNSAERVREAIDAGIRHVGENRVQELVEKNAAHAYDGAVIHFIGHLQKNKINKLVGTVELIQSVDSVELLKLISARAERLGITQDVLLEINLAGEEAKSGFAPSEIESALSDASIFGGVCIRGLMAIPPASEKSEENRVHFAALRKLFIDISAKKYDNVCMDFLSMGMSGDFRDAILEGANIVRVGTAIFGAR